MCNDCGCGVPDQHRVHSTSGPRIDATLRQRAPSVIQMVGDLLSANNNDARHNREHFEQHQVLAINLMSSPGAGKTALLEATIDLIGSELAIGVIEGDLETENDANRIRAKGVPAVQITTGNACHLDAVMVHDALHHLDLDKLDVVFIENVGNLVCPAAFDLGQHFNVALLSVTEGDDKPAKYPVMFRSSDLVIVTKTDLLPHLDDFSLQRAEAALRSSGFGGPLLETTVRQPDGLAGWTGWLRQTALARRQPRKPLSRPAEHQHRHPATAAGQTP
ncbi:MAG: hydrogenase nickel incorporation protein HypB [Xanthobacteraceae bacterium]|nr:hydrogenase nickel incorporation protein HypB [Xanthobacteraceae bacterium]